MACRLFATKPWPELMLAYWKPDSWEHTAVKFASKYKLLIHENAYGNVVCENAAILSKGRWINKSGMSAFIGSQIIFTYIC